jgi:hypothetical protein
MARTPKEEPKSEEPRKRKRRSNWAADLEHLIPGGREMSDDQLEIALDWLVRPR